MAKKSKSEDIAERALAEVEAGKRRSDAVMVEKATRIVDLVSRLAPAREHERAERKRTGDKVIAAEKYLEELVKSENPNTLAKLNGIESAWQDLDEAKAERSDALASARNARKSIEQQIEEELEESRQLGLFSSSVRDEITPGYDLRGSTVSVRHDEDGVVLEDDEPEPEDEAPQPIVELGDADDEPFEPWRPSA